MEGEVTITGKILKTLPKDFEEEFSFSKFRFEIRSIQSLESDSPKIAISLADTSISEDDLAKACLEMSRHFEAKVYLCKDSEIYGNANVYNGGSDFEVVSEECFLCICDSGEEILKEKTDHWNEKFEG